MTAPSYWPEQQTVTPWQTPTGTTGVGAGWTYNPQTQKFGGVFGGERYWNQIPQNVRAIVANKPWFQGLTQYAQQNRPTPPQDPWSAWGQQFRYSQPYQYQQQQNPWSAWGQQFRPTQQYQPPMPQQNPWSSWGQQFRPTQPYQQQGGYGQAADPWAGMGRSLYNQQLYPNPGGQGSNVYPQW